MNDITKTMKMDKNITNLEIAELLRDVAAAYQLQDETKNKFKIIAYDRAADAVEHLSSEIKDVWDEGKLEEIPGVGPSIAKHLDDLMVRGHSTHFDKLLKNVPKKAFKLMNLPKVGIKTAVKMLNELSPTDIDAKLKEADQLKSKNSRYLLPYALNIADELISWLKEGGNIVRVDPLGSLRRLTSTVGDIDISVATDNPPEVIERFTGYKKAVRVIEKGTKTASILLPGGVQVDLMVQTPATYGSLLQHFTGSKHHNIALREYALKKGLSLSEYGIKKLNAKNVNAKLNNFEAEEEFYNFLGLEYIPPELREDTGEIEASLRQVYTEQSRSAQGKPQGLPNLVDPREIKGDLHVHSDFNTETSHDLGESSMKDLVDKGNSLNYEYLAFTDHNPSKSNHHDNEVLEILKRRKEKLEELNYSLACTDTGSMKSVKNRVKYIFNSLEIDILSNGELSVPESALKLVDFALVSLHSAFNQPKEEATKRVMSGLSHPGAVIFAHPTGRLLNKREGVELDWPKIFEFCRKNNKYIEINGDPMRLDLPDFLVREAIGAGVKLSLGTDSHHADGMNNMKWAVSVARRGWAKNSDIINTKSLEEIKNILK